MRQFSNPCRVLDLRDVDTWVAELPSYAGKLTSKVLAKRLKASRGFCYSDDFSWHPASHEAKHELAKLLLKNFHAIKTFHAARPIDVGTYYQQGLLPQNREVLFQLFREIFFDLPDHHVEAVIANEIDKGLDESGKLFLGADANELLNYCGHYLINGSELIFCLAARLQERVGGSKIVKDRLLFRGIPTIFEVDVPFGLLPCSQVEELAAMMLSNWGQVQAQNIFDYFDGTYSFVLRETVPGSCIVGHTHPRSIRDPHRNVIYRPDITLCPHCT